MLTTAVAETKTRKTRARAGIPHRPWDEALPKEKTAVIEAPKGRGAGRVRSKSDTVGLLSMGLGERCWRRGSALAPPSRGYPVSSTLLFRERWDKSKCLTGVY